MAGFPCAYAPTGRKPNTSRPKPPTKARPCTRGGRLARSPAAFSLPDPSQVPSGHLPLAAAGGPWARLCAAPRGAWGPLLPRPRRPRGNPSLPRLRPGRRRRPLAARRRTGSTRPPLTVRPAAASPGFSTLGFIACSLRCVAKSRDCASPLLLESAGFAWSADACISVA